MSRGVRDLRELICVSRLTYHDSEEDIFSSDEGGTIQELQKLAINGNCSSSSKGPTSNIDFSEHALSPDSGFQTSGSPTLENSTPLTTNSLADSKFKAVRKEQRKNSAGLCQQNLSKPGLLPPLYNKAFEDACVELESGTSRMPSSLSSTGASKRGNYDFMLAYVDATIVADWLTRSNEMLADLSFFCNSGDNFVQIAHFWLSEFPDPQKQDIFKMEYEILLAEVNLAFAVGKEVNQIMPSDVLQLMCALFREYPFKLCGTNCSNIFLDYLHILTSGRSENYRKLLSDLQCSTSNKQYAQWLLATRAFALISIWVGVINFYKSLMNRCGTSSHLSLSEQQTTEDGIHYFRLLQAIRSGYVDVVHYIVSSSSVDLGWRDAQGRTLLFTAVMHNQLQVVKYLTSLMNHEVDVNFVSDSGNTALHAAVNGDSVEMVQTLCLIPTANINCCNAQCDNATPLHLAIMHGNVPLIELLLSYGADPRLMMGSLNALDLALEFGHEEIAKRLEKSFAVFTFP